MIAPSVLVRDFYADHYRPLKLRSRSANTRRLYEFSIRNFSRFLCREAALSDFTDDTLGRLMGWMVERGRSPYTVNKERSQLLAIWRFAARKKFVDHWPDVDPEVQPTRVPKAWTLEQIDALFSACLETSGKFGPVPRGLWWYGLHLLGWDTGERIAPLRAAQWAWLDLRAGLFRVPAEARKGRRADRVYRLHGETIEVLKRIEYPRRPEVFPWPYSPTYIYHLYAQVQQRAGLPAGREFRFHCLRKSVASHGKAAGLDPQELMGHIDGRTTQKYLDKTICGGRPASEVLRRPVVNQEKADSQLRLF
jgi:integrase